MKKAFVVLILLGGIFFLLMKWGEQVAMNSTPKNSLVIFSKQGCSHCHDALAFINTEVKRKYPTLRILILDVDKDNNLERLISVAKHHRIPNEQLGTPVLLLNGKILIGWKTEYKKQLLDMIRKLPAKKS